MEWTDELRRLVKYDPETGVMTRLVTTSSNAKSGMNVGSVNNRGYLTVKILGGNYKVHRLIWVYMTGEWPDGEIDHINLNKTDNRWRNLRLATREQNGANRTVYKSSTTGFKGVHLKRETGLFTAVIQSNKRRINIGYFKTPEEAAAAYRAASILIHGDFGRIADDSRPIKVKIVGDRNG